MTALIDQTTRAPSLKPGVGPAIVARMPAAAGRPSPTDYLQGTGWAVAGIILIGAAGVATSPTPASLVGMPVGAALGFFGYWGHRRVRVPASHLAAYALVSALLVASTQVINPSTNALLAVVVAAWAGAIVRLRSVGAEGCGTDWLTTSVSAGLLAAFSPTTALIGLFLGEALRSALPGVARSSMSALAIAAAPALALGNFAARLLGAH